MDLIVHGLVIPDVVGQGQAEASATLNEAGLSVGTVTYESPLTIPYGQVIGQQPAGGTLLACDSLAQVDLVVSGGGGGGIPIQFDVKPGDCENRITIPWKAADKIRVQAVIIGSPEWDVRDIVESSLRLEEEVKPTRVDVADSATQVCDVEGPDGFLDLVMSFRAQDVCEALGDVPSGVPMALHLSGQVERVGELFSFKVEDSATFVFVGPPHPRP